MSELTKGHTKITLHMHTNTGQNTNNKIYNNHFFSVISIQAEHLAESPAIHLRGCRLIFHTSFTIISLEFNVEIVKDKMLVTDHHPSAADFRLH